MNSPLSELEELNLLLDIIREARAQIEKGSRPRLHGFLAERGVSKENINQLFSRWIPLIQEMAAEQTPDPIILSERKDSLQVGALRLLFSCIVQDYTRRLKEDSRFSQSPENEQRKIIRLTPEETRRLLEISLIDEAWTADIPEFST